MAKGCNTCPTCGGKAACHVVARDRNQRVSRERFSYFRCRKCGLVFLCNVPDDLDRYYPDRYYELPASLDELAKLAEPERYRIELVQRFVPAGRFLEIGPAYGVLAYLAKEAGFAVDTIEMDARCCEFLVDVVGVNVTQSAQPEEAVRGKGPYDAIVMRHVIEHLAEPWRCLEQAAAVLAPGGILCVTTPNPAAVQFKLLRSLWLHIDAPRHLQLIPARLMKRQLCASGLKPILLTCNDRGGLDANLVGWGMSLISLVSSRLAKGAMWRIGKALNFMMGSREHANLHGSTYTLVVRKEE